MGFWIEILIQVYWDSSWAAVLHAAHRQRQKTSQQSSVCCAVNFCVCYLTRLWQQVQKVSSSMNLPYIIIISKQNEPKKERAAASLTCWRIIPEFRSVEKIMWSGSCCCPSARHAAAATKANNNYCQSQLIVRLTCSSPLLSLSLSLWILCTCCLITCLALFSVLTPLRVVSSLHWLGEGV